jgi:hypothetical protein
MVVERTAIKSTQIFLISRYRKLVDKGNEYRRFSNITIIQTSLSIFQLWLPNNINKALIRGRKREDKLRFAKNISNFGSKIDRFLYYS